MKIKNAIILAAGRGSRMRHLTDEVPKCMMTINNKTVIQRLIEVLKYKYINNIIVITGYKSDILRKHLNEIDRNIKIIQNNSWNAGNSIMSMLCAFMHLENTIVIDSDIYINNLDCIKNDVKYSGYSAVRTNRSSEWQLLVDKDNFIKETKLSGQYDNGLPIIDISYWLKEDADVIIKYFTVMFVNMMICHEDTEDSKKFWDEIPLIELLHQLRLKRYDINETDAMEFDTPEELEIVRKKVCLVD